MATKKPVLVIATRNQGKTAEIRDLLHGFPLEIRNLSDFGPIPEVEEDGLTIMANAERGAVVERIGIDFEGSPLDIAFNSRYLNDGVAAVEEDQIVLDVIDPLKPGVVRGSESGEFLYLLMPVRL